MLLVGHRGARGEAPENTIAGFAHALAVGVDALELDVRLSADGRLVVIHDETLDRTTNATGPVAALTAAQLAALDARGTCPTWPEPVGVPTLDDVLERFGARTRFAVEIKRDTPERLAGVAAATVDAMRRPGIAARAVVSSFEPEALAIVRRLAPELPRAYIGAYDAPRFLATALELGCAQADVPIATGSAEVVRAAQAHGLRVCGWLGNTSEAVRTLVAWGVDAITTDHPTIARAELGAGG
jgi:glycerophosphoryl diester phosphodiesterase